ncbi:DUF1214 domain-containing protein [Xanthobacteraceae bacterium Astr-EGSB]|uniref:DUF1214 domain-containing protein n=1 Tax=Astrobacterium formosum TaxID=3069710 RepID=UPI0027AFD98F|nr:DUF1214 domain-containing protein [Xanthobacteraceae bacterium Astr-EGSB]
MRLLLGTLFAFMVAAVVGLGGTWTALNRGVAFGAVTIGAWTAWPRAGTADIDPYAQAVVARSGALPVGLGDGVAFMASHDDAGKPLDGRCDVVLRGTTPQARFFTITLYTPDGALIATSLARLGFTSQELIRGGDGSIEVTLAPRARAGNWLATGGVERYLLALRLYDTPVGIATRAGREAPMPAIITTDCP